LSRSRRGDSFALWFVRELASDSQAGGRDHGRSAQTACRNAARRRRQGAAAKAPPPPAAAKPALEAEVEEDDEDSGTAEDIASNTASTLDELTHQECRTLYREAVENVLFAKRQQWRILEYVTALSLAFMAIGIISPLGARITGFVAVFLLCVSFFAMLVLVLLQHWQNREQAKLRRLGEAFSSFSQKTRDLKSQVVSDVHRYTILFFMELYLLIFSIATFKILIDLGAEAAK